MDSSRGCRGKMLFDDIMFLKFCQFFFDYGLTKSVTSVIIKSGINLSNREIVICRGGAMVELVKITHENLEMEHICCAIANNKDR